MPDILIPIELEDSADTARVCPRCGEVVGWDGNDGCEDGRCPVRGNQFQRAFRSIQAEE